MGADLKRLLLLSLVAEPVFSGITCSEFSELFKQQDFGKIENTFERAAQEIGYPESSQYLNKFYSKSKQDQVSEIRRIYRSCYSLKKGNERLADLMR